MDERELVEKLAEAMYEAERIVCPLLLGDTKWESLNKESELVRSFMRAALAALAFFRKHYGLSEHAQEGCVTQGIAALHSTCEDCRDCGVCSKRFSCDNCDVATALRALTGEGSGEEAEVTAEACRACKGTGKTGFTPSRPGGAEPIRCELTCARCKGSGKAVEGA